MRATIEGEAERFVVRPGECLVVRLRSDVTLSREVRERMRAELAQSTGCRVAVLEGCESVHAVADTTPAPSTDVDELLRHGRERLLFVDPEGRLWHYTETADTMPWAMCEGLGDASTGHYVIWVCRRSNPPEGLRVVGLRPWHEWPRRP